MPWDIGKRPIIVQLTDPVHPLDGNATLGALRLFTFEMDVKSVVTFPNSERSFRDKGSYEISDLAWSGRGHITRVDVSVDGGATWRRATLQEPILEKCFTRFRLPFVWDGRPLEIQSRAFDDKGWVQPTRASLIAARGTNAR